MSLKIFDIEKRLLSFERVSDDDVSGNASFLALFSIDRARLDSETGEETSEIKKQVNDAREKAEKTIRLELGKNCALTDVLFEIVVSKFSKARMRIQSDPSITAKGMIYSALSMRLELSILRGIFDEFSGQRPNTINDIEAELDLIDFEYHQTTLSLGKSEAKIKEGPTHQFITQAKRACLDLDEAVYLKETAEALEQDILQEDDILSAEEPSQKTTIPEEQLASHIFRAFKLRLRERLAVEGVNEFAEQQLEERLEALRDQLTNLLQKGHPDKAAGVLWGMTTKALDETGDVLVRAEELPLMNAVIEIEEDYRRLKWLSKEIVHAGKRKDIDKVDLTSSQEFDLSPESLEGLQNKKESVGKLCQRLKKAEKRAKNELNEKKIQLKLERVFGRGFASLLENAVLVLIIAIGILIGFEYYLEGQKEDAQEQIAELQQMAKESSEAPSIQVYNLERELGEINDWLFWIMIIDTLICVVFLFEFFIKLLFAPSRVLYFKKHWFVDLLPSLPFSLFSYGLASLHRLDYAPLLRFLRFMRLPRFVRYVRLARPIIRMTRLLLLLLRVLDRTIRRNSRLLNHDIVFFNEKEDEAAKVLSPRLASYDVGNRLFALSKQILRDQEANARIEIIRHRAGKMLQTIESFGIASLLCDEVETETSENEKREIDALSVLGYMKQMDACLVEEKLGHDIAAKISRIVHMFDLPLLRRLPVIRDGLSTVRDDPSQVSAVVIKKLGYFGERIMNVVYGFADIHGVISPHQAVDRLGIFLVNATKRPAVRLILIGFLFLLLQGVLQVISHQHLETAAGFIGKFLGLPIIILGSICLCPLVLGIWFKRLAGQASEFYRRLADAQFIDLTNHTKLKTEKQDKKELEKRVFGGKSPEHRPVARETFDLIFREYINGGFFHIDDKHTSTLLASNLAVENWRRKGVLATKQDRKRVEALYLKDAMSLMPGSPSFWFNLVVDSMTLFTAKLVYDYNMHCLSIEERAGVSKDKISVFTAWLERKQKMMSRSEKSEENVLERQEFEDGPLNTTTFTTLNFLCPLPEQDEIIAKRFGEEVLEVLKYDRVKMFRTVFSSYPFSSLNKEERTLNFYQLYQENIAGGQVFAIAWRVMLLGLKSFAWTVRFFYRKFREVLNPRKAQQAVTVLSDDFSSARRKLERMRKPLFIECIRLRAQIDPEYLGVIRGDTEPEMLLGDLDMIRCGEYDRIEFRKLKEENMTALRKFYAFLNDKGLDGEGFLKWLEKLAPGMSKHKDEVWLCLASAFIINYRDIKKLTLLLSDLIANVQELKNDKKLKMYRYSVTRLAGGTLRKVIKPSYHSGYLKVINHPLFRELSEEDRLYVFLGAIKKRKDTREWLELIAQEPDMSISDRILMIIKEIAFQHREVFNQVVAVRAIQSIAKLDLRNYLATVKELGDFKE